jgi:hypothetical protein
MGRKKRAVHKALIQSYGLFWRRDEIDWNPGKGKRYAWRLYGRRGANRRSLQIADFRDQQGIYILYGDYGPYYVGLTRKKGLGRRLKDHLTDRHANRWDRFSWFGFCKVLKSKNEYGVQLLGKMPSTKPASLDDMIADIEALLIKSMALQNINNMNFVLAEKWMQIKTDELDKFAERLWGI